MIVIYGGTFDPVHLGHIRLAEFVITRLKPDAFHFMPCFQPVHKDNAEISADHRLQMLRLAISELPEKIQQHIRIDDREIKSGQARFSLDSLVEIRDEIGNDEPLGFVMGTDSLLNLQTWYRWDELPEYCHLFVVSRPGFEWSQLSIKVKETLQWVAHEHTGFDLLKPAGNAYFLSGLELNISSTGIRSDVLANKNSISPVVFDYILRNHLYNNQP